MSFNNLTSFFIVIFLSLIYALTSSENVNNEKLIFVYEHSRHGKRSPLSGATKIKKLESTDTDLYDFKWEQYKKLTDYGKLQHYFLGIRNKYRYKNLIKFDKYSSKEILTRSTAVKRSKDSLYFQLMGMFSNDNNKTYNTTFLNNENFSLAMPENYKIWKKNKKFSDIYKKVSEFKNKKINLNLNLKKDDYKIFKIQSLKKEFAFQTTRCEHHKIYIKKTKTKKFHEKIENKFINKYSDKLGKYLKSTEKSFFLGRKIIHAICDTFISDYESFPNSKKIQNFANELNISSLEYYNTCKYLYFYRVYNIICHKKSCIMNASKLMKNILHYMEKKIKQNKYSPKMIIDVGHDNTVAPIQIMMKVAFGIKYNNCTFGSNLFFELYKNIKTGKHIIKYFDNDEFIISLDYDEFKNKIKSLIWDDKNIEDFCTGNISTILETRKEQDNVKRKKKDNKDNEVNDDNREREDNEKTSDL